MSSTRTALFLLLLATPLVLNGTATAAPPGPGGCDPYPGCHGVFVSRDGGVCAGYVYPYRGIIAGCLDDDEGVCVISGGEFWYARHCTGPLALP